MLQLYAGLRGGSYHSAMHRAFCFCCYRAFAFHQVFYVPKSLCSLDLLLSASRLRLHCPSDPNFRITGACRRLATPALPRPTSRCPMEAVFINCIIA